MQGDDGKREHVVVTGKAIKAFLRVRPGEIGAIWFKVRGARPCSLVLVQGQLFAHGCPRPVVTYCRRGELASCCQRYPCLHHPQEQKSRFEAMFPGHPVIVSCGNVYIGLSGKHHHRHGGHAPNTKIYQRPPGGDTFAAAFPHLAPAGLVTTHCHTPGSFWLHSTHPAPLQAWHNLHHASPGDAVTPIAATPP